MGKKKNSLRNPQKHWKKTRIISQIINGIISITLGFTTFTLKRPKKYVIGESYDPGYPMRPPSRIINWNTSLFSTYLPAVLAFAYNIVNSLFLLKSRINREMKNWVKILIILLNVVWILAVIFIPQNLLPIREFEIGVPWDSTFYGVYSKPKKKVFILGEKCSH
jgi:magnesium-transporting ATPase (P-type)